LATPPLRPSTRSHRPHRPHRPHRSSPALAALLFAGLVAIGGAAPARLALAQPAPKPVASGSAPAVAGSARPAGSGSAGLPAGHPPVAPGEPAGGLPPGHPQVGQDDDPHGGDPHGGDPHGDDPGGDPGGGRFKMPMQSAARDDATLPPGSITVEVRDGEGKGLAGAEVTLGIVENSIAKGESRQRRSATTDAGGSAVFAGLDRATAFAYRVSVSREGASYAAPPFNMPTAPVGVRATIFAYPTTGEVEKAAVASQGILYIEMRDEVLQFEQGYRIYNLGGTTWLPGGLAVDLPAGAKAFTSQKAMSDVVWDASGTVAKLRGTISPGMHDTAYRYQLSSPDTEELNLDIGILPHVQSFRVIVEAPKGLTMEVEGFPPAQPTTNGNGQRILFTERDTPKLDPGFRRVRVRLGNIPVRPQGRWVALGLAIASVIGAVYAATRLRGQLAAQNSDELQAARAKLLDELEALEKAHKSGEVGPKTYDRVKRALLDSLARVLARSGAV
jgi:hypothetical protein